MEKTICELFAGIGGFRLGFENASKDWKTVWFNQYEPSYKTQYAYDCYVSHYGDIDENTNKDIRLVDKSKIPNFNLLVGGFPCQDYSVANMGSKGIEGKKGVLWWQILDVIDKKNPKFVLLENVDRLLKSPSNKRGRDFAFMLGCLNERNYYVEWRVVNASDYGANTKRKRVFIFACKNNTNFYKQLSLYTSSEILEKKGFMAKSFPLEKNDIYIKDTLPTKPSNEFTAKFFESGFMWNGVFYTQHSIPKKIPFIPLKNILIQGNTDLFLSEEEIEKFKYLKGSKKIERVSKTGYHYTFNEGKMTFPDSIDLPARTILTSEGAINRSSHIIEENGKLRLLSPIEIERIHGFPDNWTVGMPNRKRYFCIGNSLVVSMITRMANVFNKIFENE